MPDKSDKHGARADDQIGRGTEGLVRGGHPTHADESRETEPYSADEPWDPAAPGGDPREGSPPGMTARDVEGRSDLARLLTGVRYPARPADLVGHASDAGAPDTALSALESLPDREYGNVADVAEELGYGRESRRF
ncbi:DUF2795 domain-containing protein [Actinomadura roseirufa]|uniref:DUF2795 domain-containing protein n=1 Tax=Actinomadura roseirufa TaxID=2094049 RepID=UPI001040EC1B|nr:DUF2795 domain-containing protein [Actinomadura roseirufa]